MSPIRKLFPTQVYIAPLMQADATDLNAELQTACLSVSRDDEAGQAWCRKHGYNGYTSYASLNDLTRRAPQFATLERHVRKHVQNFAIASSFELNSRPLKLDSLWINILKPGGVHTSHIHPHSVVSGTYYVSTPKGSSALKLEDPRLAMMMAAPTRQENAAEELQPFVYIKPDQGSVVLFESWLRHEVPPNQSKKDRISISFNYAWD